MQRGPTSRVRSTLLQGRGPIHSKTATKAAAGQSLVRSDPDVCRHEGGGACPGGDHLGDLKTGRAESDMSIAFSTAPTRFERLLHSSGTAPAPRSTRLRSLCSRRMEVPGLESAAERKLPPDVRCWPATSPEARCRRCSPDACCPNSAEDRSPKSKDWRCPKSKDARPAAASESARLRRCSSPAAPSSSSPLEDHGRLPVALGWLGESPATCRQNRG